MATSRRRGIGDFCTHIAADAASVTTTRGFFAAIRWLRGPDLLKSAEATQALRLLLKQMLERMEDDDVGPEITVGGDRGSLRTPGSQQEVSTTIDTCPPIPPALPSPLAALQRAEAAHPPAIPAVIQARDRSATQTHAGRPTSDGRFAILRPHDKGGLGEVFVARDCELNRHVALKQIQPERADDQESRRRFLLEAEITGRLEHPGIVPVYGLGQYDDGRPYYAMRFIRGESLQQRIDAYYDPCLSAVRAEGDRSLEFRKLLKHFIDTCQAVQYAHSRGVIHRDLKPANVMVGKYGETLVVDWGLAKTLGPEPGEREPDDDARLVLTYGSAGTEMGRAFGTPAYMAPEQAAGRLDLLGPRTDVYSLGATLYHLLTGRAPLAGRRDLRPARIGTGDFALPRALRPEIPAALEAVCLRAMNQEPDRRYASAGELAAEIERWLADEPVLAWPEPWLVRTRRLVKRHRALVTGTAAAIFVSLVSLSIGLVVVTNKNRELSETSQRADRNFHRAGAVVADFLTNVAESPELLRGTPGTQQLRIALLGKAQQYYDQFISENASSGLTGELAAAHFRLGTIHLETGNADRAAEHFTSALTLNERLVRENSDDAAYRQDMASSQANLGLACQRMGDYATAAERFLQAIAAYEQYAWKGSTASEFQNGLANTHVNLGTLYQETGELRSAIDQYERAIDIYEPRALEDPSDIDVREGLAAALVNLGIVEFESGSYDDAADQYNQSIRLYTGLTDATGEARFREALAGAYVNHGLLSQTIGETAEAAAHYQAAREIFDSLVKDNPAVAAYRNGLARVHVHLGKLHHATGNFGEAMADDVRALGIYEELAEDFPRIAEYRHYVGVGHINLAVVQAAAGRTDSAIEECEHAIEVLERLAGEHDVDEYHGNLAKAYHMLGELYRARGELDRGVENFHKSVEVHERLAAQNPAVSDYRHNLGMGLLQLAIQLDLAGQHQKAEERYRRVVDIHSRLVSESPEVAHFQSGLALVSTNLGILCSTTGRLDEAAEHFRAVVEIGGRLTQRFPTNTGFADSLATGYTNLGRLCHSIGRLDEAIEHYRRAAEIRQQLVYGNPGIVQLQASLAHVHINLVSVHADAGRHQEARQFADQALAVYERLVAEHPTVVEFQGGLARSHIHVGVMDEKAGEPGQAAEHFHSAIGVLEWLVDENPGVLEYRKSLGIAHDNLGKIYAATGQPDEAQEQFQKAQAALNDGG